MRRNAERYMIIIVFFVSGTATTEIYAEWVVGSVKCV